jgi:hypothetical protein
VVARPGGGAAQRLSFAHHADVRNFAKTHDLAFLAEEQRSEAFERLRRHWEKLARPPIREGRQSPGDADLWGDPLDDLIIDNMVGTEIATAPSDDNGNSPRVENRARPPPMPSASERPKRSRQTRRANRDLAAPRASNYKEYME